ncbi:MAG: hypothetical protein R3F16_25155 [Myxococcota bacterium]
MHPVVAKVERLLRYRELLWLLVVQTLALRYRRTALGFVWSLVSPVLTMAILAVVFHFVIRIEMAHYTVFLLSAMLPWSFLASTLADALVSIIHREDLVTKQPDPQAGPAAGDRRRELVNLPLAISVLSRWSAPARRASSVAWIYPFDSSASSRSRSGWA